MDVKVIVTFLLTFIIIFAVSFYIINAYWPTTKTVASINKIGNDNPMPLSSTQMVGSSSDITVPFFQGGGGSILFYVFLESAQRTHDVVNPFKTLLEVQKSFALQIMPGAARLAISTQKDLSQLKMEYIELPKIQEQKWVQVAILREGRRFDVMYNDKIVASHRLQYIPVVTINSLTAGQEGLRGILGNVRVAARRLSSQEVVLEYQRTSDTRGKPMLKKVLNITSICPPGQTCPATTQTPESTLQFWSSPYR